MDENELKLAIHDLSLKFGNGPTFKKKLSIILNELLSRYEDLNERYPRKNPIGRPKKMVKKNEKNRDIR